MVSGRRFIHVTASDGRASDFRLNCLQTALDVVTEIMGGFSQERFQVGGRILLLEVVQFLKKKWDKNVCKH